MARLDSVATMLLALAAVAAAASGATTTPPAAAAATSGGPKSSSAPLATRAVPIFANGSFLSTWHDNSVGCLRCNYSDVAAARNGSLSSFSAIVAPWGSLTFTSVATYASDSILDIWVKGSGLNSIAMYVQDVASATLSHDVRFTSTEQLGDAVELVGSDDDGFINFRLNLTLLTRPPPDNTTAANATSAAAKAAAASASACATLASAGVASRFDKIVIADVSGMGFNLVLDSWQLISPDVFAASQCRSYSCGRTSIRARTASVPVFNQDLSALRSGKNRFLMKLKDNATLADAHAICSELSGTTSQAQRFSGSCNTPPSALGDTSKRNEAGQTALGWQLATVTVDGQQDLAAMRKALGDSVEYLELDLTAFTTIRALHVAMGRVRLSRGVTDGLDCNPLSVNYDDSGCAPRGGSELSGTVASAPAEGDQDIVSAGPLTSIPAAVLNGTTNGTTNATTDGNGTASSPPPSPVPDEPPAPHVNILKPAPLPDENKAGLLQPVLDGSVDASEDYATAAGSAASWGLDRINQVDLPLDRFYSPGDYDGRGVHVYVLDTGLRTSHYDFRGRVGDGASAVGSSVNDDNGHGTHAAGTAVGSIHGVAPSATLHPVKVIGSDGTAAYSNIIAGIQWCKDHKARNRIASAVISMSLAGPRSAALNDAVEAAVAAGITVVTAAGNNNGGDSCTMSPCSAPSAITVGASTDKDSMASYSNIGSCLSLFAPGSYITSAGRTSDSAEATMSGTSMAAPHVAGVAALYLSYRPGASPAEVKAAITGASVPRYFQSRSPQRLLNAVSARLRAAGPRVGPAPPPPSPAKPSPAPVTTPSKPVAPAPAKPSPSPKPAAPSPKPAAPAPKPVSPPPPPPPPSRPVFAPGLFDKTMCAACPWCMFC